jgi:iron complex outermembrane recepter protein
MKINLSLLLLLSGFVAFSQNKKEITSDSIPSLSEIVIKGYESNRRLLETPVSASVISAADMQRFSPVSLLPSINTVPGIRMEERSPGSYRLSIRGSLLRSPFGVRNIKVYWNDIPFTDAGGNTYFNLVDQNSIQQVEILKGPGSSIYGANTGGVVILHSDEAPVSENVTAIPLHQLEAGVTAGSYGLFGEHAQWKYSNNTFSSSVTQSHTQADGYRDNARMRRDVLQWNGAAQLSEKDKLSWVMMYADLYYQTPGGLTLQQMNTDPRQSRPPTATLGGAKQQQAAIYNKTPFIGISNQYNFNAHWSNTTSAMFSYSDFENPAILNFEKRKETNLGIRSKITYHTISGIHDIKVTGGVEWQYNYSPINNYGNRAGVADTVQYKDKIWAQQFFPFLQGEWQIGKNVQLQAGASTNSFVFHYQRLTDIDNAKKSKHLNESFLPRIALLYRVSQNISLHGAVSKGFSPPAVAEIRPSEGSIYSNLKPEYGWNYEVGLRGGLFKDRLQFDVVGYIFKLQDAIVKRTADNGAEYFVNAGGTNQKGLELYADYAIIQNKASFIRLAKLWTSITLNDFSFTDYKVTTRNNSGKIDTADYSGNAITGVAKNVISAGFDICTSMGFHLNTSFTYTSKLPLNDPNAAYASPYRLLSGKLGWKKKFNAWSLDIFVGTDNALNQVYSLGNDINAAGNRFFNPAAARNYYAGFTINL